MANEAPESTSRISPSAVFFYPIIGLLAVGNAVFALLWLLNPIASGPSDDRGGRRIEVRSGDRVLRIAEGIAGGGPKAGFEKRLPGEKFEKVSEDLTGLTQSRKGAKRAKAFFESEAGRDAEPAVRLAFPREGGVTETLEVYVVDMHSQLCYCKLASTGKALAVEAKRYKAIASALSKLAGGAAGSFSPPYHMPLVETLRAKLAKLRDPLVVTTVSSDPRQYLRQLVTNPLASATGGLQLRLPDSATVIATVQLPDDVAMSRSLAAAIARASEVAEARHLDFATQGAAVVEFARSIRRDLSDIEDSMVLQYGDRVRVIRNTDMLAREEAGSFAALATRFEGETVVEQALDDLLAERGLLYFAEGHGERRVFDSGLSGLSGAVEQLKARGFRVAMLDLTKAKSIPPDCDTLIIAGPRRAYSPASEKVVARYVDAGGRLALMVDPPNSPDVVTKLLKRYNLAVADESQEVPAVQLELERRLGFARAWTRKPIVFITAVPIVVTKPPEKATHQVLRIASSMDTGSGRTYCLIAGARPAPGAKGPKILVFSDVDAFTNQSISGWPGRLFGMPPGRAVPLPGNIELLTSALAWLAE